MRKASVDEIFTITKGKGCWRSGRKEEKKVLVKNLQLQNKKKRKGMMVAKRKGRVESKPHVN